MCLHFHGNTDFFRIPGWFKHPLISTSTCFYWFWPVVSWMHWHFPPSSSEGKPCSTSTNFFFLVHWIFISFWSLGMEKQLSCHYQLWSINLKEKKEETPAQGSPSQQTFPDKKNIHISDTSSAPRNLPQNLGGFKGCFQKPKADGGNGRAPVLVPSCGVNFAVMVFWPWYCSWIDIYCQLWNLMLI